MNVSEDIIETIGYDKHFASTKMALETIFGECEVLLSTDTLQYNDYDKYEHEIFNKEEKSSATKRFFRWTANALLNWGARWHQNEVLTKSLKPIAASPLRLSFSLCAVCNLERLK